MSHFWMGFFVKRLTLALATVGLVGSSLAGAFGVSAAAADPTYTVQTLHFLVKTGPTGATTCDIIGDLYTPATASVTSKVPAILTTNGFGGSKDDQAGIGKSFAARGFEVLSYSGLGFGGSGCRISLDDPDFDGQAARQLVSFLGGASGIAFTDAAHTVAVPVLDVVKRDVRDHLGHAVANDPRVGMVGGSYGGQIQFAAASVDPRIDTIVPIITWSDLSYSLGPNNTDQVRGVTTTTPGAIKFNWGLGFSALGVENGLSNAQVDTTRLIGCPNFVQFVCPALVTAAATGYFQPNDVKSLQHASVTNYISKIRIPTLLIQGEADTLFNLNEGAANFSALKAQGTPVKMIWQSWGHSDGTPAPGEIDLANPDPTTQYETARIAAWFDHYLKDSPVSTGPVFAYFRNWISYSGIATPAYASSATFPVGTTRKLFLSGAGDLATSPLATKTGSQNFVTPPAALPSSFDPIDAIGSIVKGLPDVPEKDLPGTFASWKSAALTVPLNVAGSPVLTVTIKAPTAALTQAAGPAGQLVLFAKIVDIAPDGTSSLIKGQVAPIRIPDVNKPVKVTMPGIVHQFAPGHRIGLIIAGGSINYRGGLTPVPVTIVSGAGQVLSVPSVN